MILLVNGPNLNLLGERPGEAGGDTLADVERVVRDACAGYGRAVTAFQSNSEGAILDFLHEHRREAEGVIVNPGALAQTSRALADCLAALPCPAIEVHLANVHAREAWRRESVVAPVALGQITGLGVDGYRYAAVHLCARLVAAAVAGGRAPAREPPPRAAPPPQYAAPRPARAPPQPSVGVEHAQAPWPDDPGSGALRPAPPGEEIAVDVNARGEYEPL